MELLDVYPTVAALAGLQAPSFTAGRDISSLVIGTDVGSQDALNAASAAWSANVSMAACVGSNLDKVFNAMSCIALSMTRVSELPGESSMTGSLGAVCV